MDSHLKYGQLVIFQGFCKNKSDEVFKGFLSSTGGTEKRVFFQQSTIDLIEKETTNDKSTLPVIRNFNSCVFQIWPKLNYDAHKDFEQLKEMESKLKWKLK